MFSPPFKALLHRQENGRGGTRTRIYDYDRVSCCHYTTGPEVGFSRASMGLQGSGSQLFHDLSRFGNRVRFTTRKETPALPDTSALPWERDCVRCDVWG